MAAGRSWVLVSATFLILLAIFYPSRASSDCKPGTFGWKCRFTCDCKNGEQCDQVTGACPNGCREGKYGSACQYVEKFMYGVKGITYAGTYGTFSGNKTCLRWDDPLISKAGKKYTADQFIEGVIPGPYCRNPIIDGKYASYPWCYVATGIRDIVEVHLCDKLLHLECPDGRFGKQCEKVCHCLHVNEVCDKDIGTCNSNCAPGWRNVDCQDACPQGWFGLQCREKCGQCRDNSCHLETGICTKGCQPGYKGRYCNTACEKGSFWIDCVHKCGQCRYGDTCLFTSGECVDGCAPGYQGSTCQQRCPNSRYGIRCQGSCPYCLDGEACHPETGVCERGCSSGYQGDSCDTACEDGFYGLNCSQECGHCHMGDPCDKVSGYCLGTCADGFHGPTCAKALTHISSAGSAVGGAIAGVVIVLLITAVVIALIVWRRRRFKKKLVVSGDLEKTVPTTETTLENIKETDTLLRTPSTESYPEENGHCEKRSEEPIYVNVSTKKLMNPIKVEDLSQYVIKGKAKEFELMKKEHMDLPTGQLALCHTALKPENKIKNRYGDIIAYDHSRIVLTPLLHDPHSDYVNANYMDMNIYKTGPSSRNVALGYNKPKAYIASQGPNKAMLNDFWRMIWQLKVTKIVMLTNLVETCKKKCEQYWPLETSGSFGDVSIEVLDVAEYTDYTIRTFKITMHKVNRIIKQFHFTSWTDHGAPTYPTPLLNFRRKVQQYNPDSQGPVLVHCSAGIGRTGTYIATDYLLQQAKVEGQIDLLQYAQLMRSNRVNMIQTWQQYSFVYDALLEALLAGDTTISSSAFSEAYEDLCTLTPGKATTPLEDQFEILQQLSPVIERDECKAATCAENMAKSRFRNILPANRFRPHLYTPVEGFNDFINAVFLPSYTHRDAFIVTQMPLPNTVADFWRLLYDYHSDTVVMLNEFDRNDRSCALYWPEEYGYTVEHGPLSIELLFSSEADPNITVRTFKLTNSLKGEDRAVKQFQFNAWPDYKSVPVGTTAFIRLAEAVQDWTRQNGKGPVTVHCMNGASKSGLFCACNLVFERMRVDHEVDVYQTVKQIRINRPHFVENMEQYQFCYQMALTYLDKQGSDRQAGPDSSNM